MAEPKPRSRPLPPHGYAAVLTWTGNTGSGTRDYAGYSRDYEVSFEGKPPLNGSADKRFRGDPTRHDPENHFLAAISGCHMLSYLALAAQAGICVTAYRDEASGVLEFDGAGGGRFTSITLRPTVTVTALADRERARTLHDDAHRACYIAASCSTPIGHEPVIVVEPV